MQLPPFALDLDHFPDSPYATELRRDFPDMRFSPELEQEFQAFQVERVHARVRFFQLALFLLSATAAVHLIALDHVPAGRVLSGWLGVVLPTSVFLVWASRSRYYERLYLRAARVALPVFAVASAVGVAGRVIDGHPDQFYLLTTYSIVLYFLGGQLFRESLIAIGLMILAHGAALAYVGQPAAAIAYHVGVLCVTGAVGAFVYRGIERQLRTSFLERGLMGEMATRDGLTSLKNRGAFEDYFPRMWQQALRDHRSVVLLLIDVDHFKAYNDRYGHQAGDRTLRRVAQVVHGFARRPLDMAARYGGEEFVIALFDLDPDSVRRIAEELRNAIYALNIMHEDSETALYVTASVGASIIIPRLGRSSAGAVQLADEALYSAKRSGRNTVAVVDAEYTMFSTGTFRRRA
jgi:diguanylate cyclase (GGDEF)-like protein